MVYQCIEDNTPIRTQWQIAPDVIVVREERLVHPPPIITTTAEMNKFFTGYMNDEQSNLAAEALQQLQLGNATILKEDLFEWLHLCNSGIGPVACNISPKDSFYNVSFPTEWHERNDELLTKIYSPISVTGTAEEAGIMNVESILENLATFGGVSTHVDISDAPLLCTEEPNVEATKQYEVVTVEEGPDENADVKPDETTSEQKIQDDQSPTL